MESLAPFKHMMAAHMSQEHGGWRLLLNEVKDAEVWYDESAHLYRVVCSVYGAQHAPRSWSSARLKGVYTLTMGRCTACNWGFSQFGSRREAILEKYPRDMRCPFCSIDRSEDELAWAREHREANAHRRAYHAQCAANVYDPPCVLGLAVPDHRYEREH